MVLVSSPSPTGRLPTVVGACPDFDPARLVDEATWPGSTVLYFARQLIGRAGLTSSDLDDVRQDLAVHALVQWPKFDSSRSSARTFLDRILRQRQRAILRKRRSKRRRATNVLLTSEISHDKRRSRSRDHVATADCRHDIARTLAPMPLEERHLASGLARHSITQLARLQRRHRQRLHESLRRIRRRFEDAGLREYLS